MKTTNKRRGARRGQFDKETPNHEIKRHQIQRGAKYPLSTLPPRLKLAFQC